MSLPCVILFHISARAVEVAQEEGGLGMADLGKGRLTLKPLRALDGDLFAVGFDARHIGGIYRLISIQFYIGFILKTQIMTVLVQSADGSSKNLKKTAFTQKGVAVM